MRNPDTTTIPPQATQAAIEAVRKFDTQIAAVYARRIATAALEAAAPHIIAAAYPDAFEDGAQTAEHAYDLGIAIGACNCECRQCAMEYHCSSCWKDRRAEALRRVREKSRAEGAAAERQRIRDGSVLRHDHGLNMPLNRHYAVPADLLDGDTP